MVLNWGKNPEDLDLMVTQINAKRNVRCMAFWDNRQCPVEDDDPEMSLDVDNIKVRRKWPSTGD